MHTHARTHARTHVRTHASVAVLFSFSLGGGWRELRACEGARAFKTQPCNKRCQPFLRVWSWFALCLPGWKNSKNVWEPDLPKGQRMLVKRGVLKIADLDSKKNKIKKKKATEVFMFSDMFLYARVVKTKKTGQTRYLVFKVAHRTLLKAAEYKPKDASKKEMHILEVNVLSMQGKTDTSYFLAKDQAELERWLEVFNPPKEDDLAYEKWEMPEAEVIKDFEASKYSPDELTLRKGQFVAIEKRGLDQIKGGC